MSNKKRKKRLDWRLQVVLIFGALAGIVFLPTTVLLLFGMLPTGVAILVDTTPNKTKSITVGAFNLAGCSPFVFELWTKGHDFDMTFTILSDPMAIVVMYAGAGVGYIIDWAMTGIVATILVQRAESRKKAIKKTQKELYDRWGKEVTGEYTLDEYGFAVQTDKDTEVKPAKQD